MNNSTLILILSPFIDVATPSISEPLNHLCWGAFPPWVL